RSPSAPLSSNAPFLNYLNEVTDCAHPSLIVGDFNYPNIDWYTNYLFANWDMINSQIAMHNWTIALSNKTATDAYCYFSEFFNSLLDIFVPIKRGKSSSGYPKYLSQLHDRLHKLHQVAPNCDTTHSLRVRFDNALKSFELKRESKAVNSKNPNQFFQFCKSHFKVNTSSLPGIIDSNGNVLLTNKDKATAFSKFFSKVQTPPMHSRLPIPSCPNSSFDLPFVPISDTDRLKHFQLETLEYRRSLSDMYFIYDSLHDFVHLDTSCLYTIAPLTRSLRSSHKLRIAVPYVMPSSFSSCASRSLTLWNSLPHSVVTMPRSPYRHLIKTTPSFTMQSSNIKM
ncbi:hypothetical protein PMAYCL1PPCAC_25258, partial [Pristionchus mayeri]